MLACPVPNARRIRLFGGDFVEAAPPWPPAARASGAFASLEATSLKLRPVAALHCGLPPAPLAGLVNYDFDSCLRLLGAGWRPF